MNPHRKSKQLLLSPKFREFYFDNGIHKNNKPMNFGFKFTEEFLDACVKYDLRPHFFGPEYFYNLLENEVIEPRQRI